MPNMLEIGMKLDLIREESERVYIEKQQIWEKANMAIDTVLEALISYPTQNRQPIKITDTEYLRFDGSRILIGSAVGPDAEENIKALPAKGRLALCDYFPKYLEEYRKGLE